MFCVKTWFLLSLLFLVTSAFVTEPEPYDPNNQTSYELWCLNVTENTIYDLGSKLNCRDNSETYSMSVVVVISISLIIELVLHLMDHFLSKQQHKLMLHLWNKILKEFLLLGVMSLCLNVLESINALEWLMDASHELFEWLGITDSRIWISIHSHDIPQSKEDVISRRVKIFDFVHVSLFFLSIAYGIIVAVCFIFVRWICRRWKHYETKQTEIEVLEEYQQLQTKFKSTKLWLRPFCWRLIYKLLYGRAKLNFFTVRHRFIKVNRVYEPLQEKSDEQQIHQIVNALRRREALLSRSNNSKPLNKDRSNKHFFYVERFPFYLYLKERLYHIFSELIEISWKLWLLVWFLFLVNYLRNKFVDFQTAGSGVVLFCGGISLVAFLMIGVISIAVRVGFYRYIKDYDLRHVPLEELFREPKDYYRREPKNVLEMLLRPFLKPDLQNRKQETVNLEKEKVDPLQFSSYATTTTLVAPPTPHHDRFSTIVKERQVKGLPQLVNILKMHRYFMFRMPKLTFGLIQFSILIQAYYFAMLLLHFVYVIVVEDFICQTVASKVIVLILCFAPFLLITFILIPSLMDPFVVLYSVEDRTELSFVRKWKIAQQRKLQQSYYMNKKKKKIMEQIQELHLTEKEVQELLLNSKDEQVVSIPVTPSDTELIEPPLKENEDVEDDILQAMEKQSVLLDQSDSELEEEEEEDTAFLSAQEDE